MPVIALKGMVILPGMLVHLDIKRDISKKAVDEAMAGEGVVFITNQNDENVELPLYKDLRAVGVVAKIRQVMRLEEDVVRALVSTTDRATLLCLNQNEPVMWMSMRRMQKLRMKLNMKQCAGKPDNYMKNI